MPNAAQFTVPGSTAPSMISLAAGTFYPPGGVSSHYPALSLAHYYDGPLAAACFAESNRLCQDAAAIASLDVPFGGVTRATGVAQVEYVYRILSWLAAGYNALNILWYMDPVAAQYYRQYISGAPQGTSDGERLQAQFGGSSVDHDYRRSWYSYATQWPRIQPPAARRNEEDAGNTPMVGLPMLARSMFERVSDRGATNPSDWVQLAGLYIDGTDDDIDNPRDYNNTVVYLSSVRNRAFAMNGAGHVGLVGSKPYIRVDGHAEDPSLRADNTLPPSPREIGGSSNRAVYGRFNRAVMWGGVAYADLPPPPSGPQVRPDGSFAPASDGMDWRYMQFDEAVVGPAGVGVPVKIANALKDYLGWLSAWARACTVRNPVDIISQARLYIIWVNGQVTAQNPSANDVIDRDAQLAADRARVDPGVNAALTAVGAIAPSLSAAGPIGAAIGLGVASAAAIARVVLAVVGSGPSSLRKRNELGDFKPEYVRAALSGSVIHGEPPSLQIAAPPGWSRPPSRFSVDASSFFYGGSSPPSLDGSEILTRLGMTPAQWTALSPDQQRQRLSDIGYPDDAAIALAEQAIHWYIDPSSRPREYSASRGGSVLVFGAAAIAAALWFMRDKRR